MLIKFIPVRAESSLRRPVTESWYAARQFYGFSGLGSFAGCPAGTTQGAPPDGKCCVSNANWDGLDKRCMLPSNNPVVVTSPNGKSHLKAGSGGGGGCSPNCSGKQCGDDGCGGSCGSCSGTDECQGNSCVPSTSGGGGSTTTGGGGSGGGGIVSVGGDGGSSIDFSSLLNSPVVWVAGGLLLVAVTYRLVKGAGKSPAAAGVTVVR